MLTVDFETRSACDLRKCGAHRYAEDQSTEVICLGIQRDADAPRIWYADAFRPAVRGMPELIDTVTVQRWLNEGHRVTAHKAEFERALWPRTPFLPVPLTRWDCTAARAAACNLPRSLEGACSVLKLPQQKDKEGHALMLKLCKPRRAKRGPRWHETPEDLIRLGRYCLQDVRAEYALHLALPELSERWLWELDQRINDRGIPLDRESISACAEMLEQYQAGLNGQIAALTSGEITATTQVARILDWAKRLAPGMTSLDSAAIDAQLADPATPVELAQVLGLRQRGSKASTAKLRAMGAAVQADGRIRGTQLYHGALTGRWTGRLLQPHNIPRGELSSEEVDSALGCVRVLGGIPAPFGAAGLTCPAEVASSCLRGLIQAPPGRDLVASDFANIEGRVAAWFGGEAWKLQVFREFDAGVGPDLYKVSYARSFGVPVDQVTPEQRQIGKVQELALGYQGGIGAFRDLARQHGLDLDTLASDLDYSQFEPSDRMAAADLAEDFVSRNPGDTSKPAAFACDLIKRRWRRAHPGIVSLWGQLQGAFTATVLDRAPRFIGPLGFRVSGNVLRLTLPSGRDIIYPEPRAVETINRWGKPALELRYHGTDTLTKRWTRLHLYGGLIFENVVQATARDILAEALGRVDRRGYPIVLHVHDEIVCEIPEAQDSTDFDGLLSVTPPWAEGLPIAAKGWRGKRYRKD